MKKKQPTTNSLLVVSTIRRLLKKILSGINKSQKFDFNFVQAKNVISSVRIVLSDNINFEISFVEAKTFNPSDGVEVGSQQYRKTIVFLGKKYSIKKIKSIFWDEIRIRKGGLTIEKSCEERILLLIKNDSEFIKIIYSVGRPTNIQNRDYKIDLILKTKKGFIPLQIKSSIKGRLKHKLNDKGVPSLVYYNEMEMNDLRKKLLLIYKSFPDYMEHL